MSISMRSRRIMGIINGLLTMIMALTLTFTAAGQSSQPEDEPVVYPVYAPLVMRYSPYTESIGVLDPRFSEDGWLLTNYSGSLDYGYAVVMQGDGKIVVAGSYDGPSRNFGLARYNPDGSLDTSFDEDGRVVTDFFDSYDDAYAIAIQSDGKIVVAGSAYNGSYRNDFALARYNQDGSLDTTFGGDGRVTTDFSSNVDYARAVAVQPDGKIVAAGYTWTGSNYDFALVRYNPDGSLDTTFDVDGRVTTNFAGKSDYAYALVVAGDKLVVAGEAKTDSYFDFAVAQYNLSDGSLDTELAGSGIVTISFSDKDDRARALVRQGDGKLLVAGWTDRSGNNDFALARLDTEGNLDVTFDSDGRVTTDFSNGADYGYGIALDANNGDVFVAGYTYNGIDNNFALARYDANGTLDPTFDGDGMVVTDFDGRSDWGYALTRQADGRLVVAGKLDTVAGSDFAAARYNTDGSLDTGFDEDGLAITNLFGSSDLGQSVVLLPDGKLVLAGYVAGSTGTDFGVARYYANGSPDSGFGGNGRVATDIDGRFDYAYAAAVQSDGKLVVAGAAGNGIDDDFALVRYNSDGSLDTSFDGDGKVITDFAADVDTAYALLVQPDGKIVLAGEAEMATGLDFALARYNPDGSLDTSFGTGGKVTTDLSGNDDSGRALVRQEDGKLLVGGYVHNGTNYDFAVARYNANGSLDTSFDGDGKVNTNISGNDYGYGIALQTDGKIVVVGRTNSGTYDNFALVRYIPNGSLDNSFDGDGRVITDISGSDDYATAVILQPNGKLVVAGTAYMTTSFDFALVRYNDNGSLDADFSGDGWLTLDFYQGDDVGLALLMQPSGRLIIAGYADNGTDYDYAIARYR